MGATTATPEASTDPRQAARRQAKRIIGIVRDANNGWPELAKTNPELAEEFRAEHQAIIDCREHAANDPDLLGMELD